jgi:hypothetical protein
MNTSTDIAIKETNTNVKTLKKEIIFGLISDFSKSNNLHSRRET